MLRFLDIFFSFFGMLFLSPLLIFIYVISLTEGNDPLFVQERLGKEKRPSKLIKFRTMKPNTESIASHLISKDQITTFGKFLRSSKIDELPQLWNVFKGEMSFVGPRPNVLAETKLYTDEEKKLLSVRPGITDFASIVFSDEGDILDGSNDPDLDYNQLIRPWKSRLGIFYIENKSILLDIKLIFTTALAIVSKRKALEIVVKILITKKADNLLIRICKRKNSLKPYHPPGSNSIVVNR